MSLRISLSYIDRCSCQRKDGGTALSQFLGGDLCGER